MGEIVNLRQVRKSREKAEREALAEQNRIRFGQPRKARTLAEKRASLEAVRHEGHRLKDPDEA